MSPKDETLTLVFKMLQKIQETLVPPRQKRKYIDEIQRMIERDKYTLLLTSLT
jgi:hypothetical protein